MKIAILSDIHGNHGALQAVLAHIRETYGDEITFFQLGDLVNYGPRPNEAVDAIRRLEAEGRLRVNLAGNHEAALFGLSADRFSTERGKEALWATAELLRGDNRSFLQGKLGFEPASFHLDGRDVLCVHGSLADPHWGALRGAEIESPAYARWDVVFCGHTHVPLWYEQFHRADDPRRRNQRKTVFVNPGSVGQPRNHDPRAQYAVWDTEADEFRFHRIAYDVPGEQACYTGSVDAFYRQRLALGV